MIHIICATSVSSFASMLCHVLYLGYSCIAEVVVFASELISFLWAIARGKWRASFSAACSAVIESANIQVQSRVKIIKSLIYTKRCTLFNQVYDFL